MANLKIAVAQLSSIKGDVDANIISHILAVEKASSLGVSYMVFPELSLTGYEPELASELAFSNNDIRLAPLIKSALDNKMTIAVGAPVKADGLPKIGLIIITETGVIEKYEKMNLHPGEDKYFAKGSRHHLLTIKNTLIANAICADTNNPEHVRSCFNLGAVAYIAGVLITEGGYDTDAKAMAGYACEHNILVAMANHNTPTGDWSPVGKSAIWFGSELLVSACEKKNTILVAEKSDEKWSGQIFRV